MVRIGKIKFLWQRNLFFKKKSKEKKKMSQKKRSEELLSSFIQKENEEFSLSCFECGTSSSFAAINRNPAKRSQFQLSSFIKFNGELPSRPSKHNHWSKSLLKLDLHSPHLFRDLDDCDLGMWEFQDFSQLFEKERWELEPLKN